jgi:mannose-6-phosphate isomerase-like protein (cupin superfamily)
VLETAGNFVLEGQMSATAFDPQRRRFGPGGGVDDIVATSEETRNTHFALIATEPPGGGPPLYTHAEDEFFFVLDGDISFWIDGRITVASAGETRCLPCMVLPVLGYVSQPSNRFEFQAIQPPIHNSSTQNRLARGAPIRHRTYECVRAHLQADTSMEAQLFGTT